MSTSPPTTHNWTNSLSAAVAVIALVGGILWYVARMDARINAIEADLSSASKKTAEAALTCGELAAKVADAYRSGDGTRVAKPLESLMDRMDCNSAYSKAAE